MVRFLLGPNCVKYPTASECVRSVIDGQFDCFVVHRTVGETYLRRFGQEGKKIRGRMEIESAQMCIGIVQKNPGLFVEVNAALLAQELAKRGFRIVSGGTDNHLMLIDLRPKHATGKAVANALDLARITVNKNMIPFDPEKPFVTSGIRVGTPAVTTRGFKEPEIVKLAEFIERGVEYREDEAKLRAIGEEVKEFMRAYPMPRFI